MFPAHNFKLRHCEIWNGLWVGCVFTVKLSCDHLCSFVLFRNKLWLFSYVFSWVEPKTKQNKTLCWLVTYSINSGGRAHVSCCVNYVNYFAAITYNSRQTQTNFSLFAQCSGNKTADKVCTWYLCVTMCFYFATHLSIHKEDTIRSDAKLDLSSHVSQFVCFISKLPFLTLKLWALCAVKHSTLLLTAQRGRTWEVQNDKFLVNWKYRGFIHFASRSWLCKLNNQFNTAGLPLPESTCSDVKFRLTMTDDTRQVPKSCS